MYSLGYIMTDKLFEYNLLIRIIYLYSEVTGPSLGGWLSENFDFSIASTIMAGFSLLGVITD